MKKLPVIGLLALFLQGSCTYAMDPLKYGAPSSKGSQSSSRTKQLYNEMVAKNSRERNWYLFSWLLQIGTPKTKKERALFEQVCKIALSDTGIDERHSFFQQICMELHSTPKGIIAEDQKENFESGRGNLAQGAPQRTLRTSRE